MSKESDTERDGAFSYAAEWHAFAHGMYVGFTTKPWYTPTVPDNPDVAKELHYYRGGYVAGSVLQVIVLVVAATYGFLAL